MEDFVATFVATFVAAFVVPIPNRDRVGRSSTKLATKVATKVRNRGFWARLYHIFGVNGLRMAIAFGILFGLFRALGLPRPLSGPALTPLIWMKVGAPVTSKKPTKAATSLQRPSPETGAGPLL
jgi:hypothetical protein